MTEPNETIADWLDPATFMPRARNRIALLDDQYIRVKRRKMTRYALGASCPKCWRSIGTDILARKNKNLCQCSDTEPIFADDVLAAHGLTGYVFPATTDRIAVG